jgi:hypothetical protein
MRRQRIKTGNGLAVRSEDKDSGQIAVGVSRGLPLDRVVERGHATAETGSIMLRAERFDRASGGKAHSGRTRSRERSAAAFKRAPGSGG